MNVSSSLNRCKYRWYQITLTDAGENSHDVLFGKLREALKGQEFHPICYKRINGEAYFYVEGFETAKALLNLSEKVFLEPDKCSVIRIKKDRPRVSDIDEVIEETIKSVLLQRYDSLAKELNLSSLHQDPGFLDELFLPLSDPAVLVTVFKVMVEHFSEVEMLNLSFNGIYKFDEVEQMISNFKNLRVLSLEENKIPALQKLSCFTPLEIVELTVRGNPLFYKLTDKNKIMSEVRNWFPHLMMLDGEPLEAPILFLPGDNKKGIAAVQKKMSTFFCTSEARSFAEFFTTLYFQVFDSDDRLGLGMLYHENASFSMSTLYLPPPLQSQEGHIGLSRYVEMSRNHLSVPEATLISEVSFEGRDPIIKFLDEQMPKTKHRFESFIVDVPSYSWRIITLYVSGMLQEENGQHMRFSRKFAIDPVGAYFYITKDILILSQHVPTQQEGQQESTSEIELGAPQSVTDEVVSDPLQMSNGDVQPKEI